jgi:trehalose/maltose hydrolase-like predicted phosphorylase
MTMFPDDFTAEQKRNVFEHYEPITLHDSTLSYGPHAQLAFRLGLWDKAEDYLKKAVYLDLKDVMGNTGREGLHMAAMGSVWQAVAFGALGLGAKGGVPTASPMLPSSIRRIRMNVAYHGKRYAVTRRRHARYGRNNDMYLPKSSGRRTGAAGVTPRRLIGMSWFCLIPIVSSLFFQPHGLHLSAEP